MFTPQQIDQISFGKSTFGGYNMQQVDDVLEPLTEDYVTLYKENALLKSKMRVLVGKLEEYRKNEKAQKESVANAQAEAEKLVREAQAKCAQMVNQAHAAAKAMPSYGSSDALVSVENARVEEARRIAGAKITEIQDQMRACIQALERIKSANPTSESSATSTVSAAPAAVKSEDLSFDSGAVANEISQSVEALVGTTDDVAPKPAPKHPTNDATTSRFSALNLQFGRNYDPTQR